MDDNRTPTPGAISITTTAHRLQHTGQLQIDSTGADADAPQGPEPAELRARGAGSQGAGLAAEGRRASQLLKELGDEFVRLRAENRTAAWAAYQRKIASNLHILVPAAIGLKDATSLLREIEEFMKTDAGASVATPSERIREWLNSENTTVTMRAS